MNVKKCKKRWLKPVNRLIKKFPNTLQLCNGDINKFVLLLRKGVDPYEYIYSWGRFDETLPDKKAFYNELYLEHITYEDYTYIQKIFGELKLKSLETSVLKYELDPAFFFFFFFFFCNKITMASLFKKD